MPTLATQLTVTGINQVHTYLNLPATLSVFPCLILLPQRGSQMFGGSFVAAHEVQATLYIASQFLPEAYAVAVPFIERIRNALGSHIKLGLSSIDHAQPAPGNFYEGPGSVKYGDKEHIGIIFRIEVKEHDPFTVAA
jgi:hypothetical protein